MCLESRNDKALWSASFYRLNSSSWSHDLNHAGTGQGCTGTGDSKKVLAALTSLPGK